LADERDDTLPQQVFRVANKPVKVALQMFVRAAQSGHYVLAPLNIFLSTLKTPSIGRILDDVLNVADLVGEFDLLRPVSEMGSVLDLQTLSFGFRKRLIIREFANVISDSRSKMLFEFRKRHVAILDSVMQDRGDDKIVVVNLTYIDQKIRYLERVIDVRLAVAAFSSLVPVLVGCEARSVKDLSLV
jgi:hypothetical protein